MGAQKGDILRLVVGEGFLVSLVGVAIGVVAAFGVTRLIANRLFGVTPMDPLTITAVALVLIGVALFACYIPARRATKIDPVVASGLSDTHQPSLRSEEARQCFVLAGLCSGVLGARTELSTRKSLELFETVDHAHWLPLVSATLKGCATEEVEIRTGISVAPSGLGHR